MGDKIKKKKYREETTSSSSSQSPSESSSSESDLSSKRKHHKRKYRHRERESGRDRSGKKRDRERDSRRRKSRRDDKSKKMKKKKKRDYNSESDSFSDDDASDLDRVRTEPKAVVHDILREFPNVGDDLRQLLQMIDNGQAVDIKGISEVSLKKHLKKLFLSLDLKENGDRVFLLPSNVRPTLEVIGYLIHNQVEQKEQQLDCTTTAKDIQSGPSDSECKQEAEKNNLPMPCPNYDASVSRRRTIGPEMPSAELLAAAAKLTEAQDELRDAELEEDNELFIGPPPPAVVAEAESANEAERFEEVTRIMTADVSPYDVLGVNMNMSAENIKKRYWKLSLLVHPDKCTHPQAHQAFIMLNKSFKELQDPDKRKVLDDKIRLKEEQENFKAELRGMREAAQWRRLQGISMEGDDELLAEVDVKVIPTRDEWMTKLPPERNPNSGMPMQSTQFNRTTKEGRGDTTAWTDTPSDRAKKAKTNYLEAYNEAAALASNEDDKKRMSTDADLVDKYNKAKRSKSLVQKHQEEAGNHSNKKSKKKREKEEWAGQHPWKPWDREKDLTAGRQNVKLDSENMVEGLTSRFSSGNFQRNFL